MSDPCTICAASADKSGGATVIVFEGVKFFFCSVDCLRIFQAFPDAYAHDEIPELKSIEDSGA
jgi:YHS domain-containing protein